MVKSGGEMLLFGGRVEGKERVYSNDMWRRSLGPGELWAKIENVGKNAESWPSERHNHALVALEGVAILHGGSMHGAKHGKRFDQVYLNDLWQFRPDRDTWELLVADGGPRRHCHALVNIGNSQLLLFGGFGDGAFHNDVWVFDLETLTWSEALVSGEVPHKRSQMGACVSAGKLWVFGGYFWSEKRCEQYFDDLWSLSLSDRCWTRHQIPGAPSPRNRVSMAEVAPLRVLVINGNFYRNARGTDEWYDQVYELQLGERIAWRLIKCGGRGPKQSHMACIVDRGVVYLFGGEKQMRRMNTLHLLTVGE